MTRETCEWCGAAPVPGSRCPWSVRCPTCRVAPGRRCRRPSGHGATMHAERWQLAEAEDAANGIAYPADS